MSEYRARHVDLHGARVELFEGGAGAPLLFLHGGQGLFTEQPWASGLAASRRVVAPSHPGFGESELPDWIDRAEDMASIYLELMDQLDLAAVDVVGCSIGGWIAAEMASLAPERVSRLALVAPVGVKTGPSDRLDIPDIYVLPQAEVEKLIYHDPEAHRIDPAQLDDQRLSILLRNREALALLAWEPYMHNPKLPPRLRRATMPTLFVRGASDGIVSADYLERYAAFFPDSRIETIPAAGHALHIEQPDAFVRTLLAFLDG